MWVNEWDRGKHLKVFDEVIGAFAQGSVVDHIAARLEQQQIVKRLRQSAHEVSCRLKAKSDNSPTWQSR